MRAAAWFALGLAAVGMSNAQGAKAAMRTAIEIPPEDLNLALQSFGEMRQLHVIYVSEDVRSRRTPGVTGTLNADEALSKILTGTGLTYHYLDESTVTIVPIAVTPAALTTESQPTPRSHADKRSSWSFFHLAQVDQSPPGAPDGVSSGPARGSQVNSGTATRLPTGLEEVTVIARRRTENLQTVPVAVTVLSQQTLQDNNVQTVNDLTYIVPSLSGTTPIPNAIRLNLRGQGASGNQSWPGVILFVNEVPIPNFGGGAVSTGPGMYFDLENVQVLKGPQGTLFGKNSVGGDILLQTARPKNDFGANVQVGFGNFRDREVDGAFNIPIISDVLLARLAVSSQLRDGYTHILSEPAYPNGIDGDNRDYRSIRATVTFHPTGWFQNDLIYMDSQYSSRGTYGVLVDVVPSVLAGVGSFFPAALGIPEYLAQQQAAGIRTAIPINVNDVANGFTRSVTNITRVSLANSLTIKNIFGHYEENQVFAGDQDNTVLPFFDVYSTPRDQTITQITDELQLSGKSFAERLDWIVGGFYQHQPTPDWTLEADNAFGGSSFDLDKHAEQSNALYAHGIYDLSPTFPGVRISAGLRHSHDSFTSIKSDGLTATCTGPVPGCPIAPPGYRSGSSNALTWTAGIDYQATPDTLLYLTSRKGYRPGGNNGINVITRAPLPLFDPEYVQDLELGVKSEWSIGNVQIRTNTDLWGQNFDGIQEQVLIAQGNTPTLNAGSAKLWGAELEAVAELTANLELGVTYDHGSIRYTSFLPGVSASAIAQLEASRTLDFPPNKYGARVRYRMPLAADAGNLSLRVAWSWQATSGDVSVPNGFGMKPAFGLLNLSADWNGIYGRPIDVSLFASNVLDKVYATQAVPSFETQYFGYANEMFGEPRMYGIRFRVRFGDERI